jgi:anaerobic selenocysteine-containing dehydrogenase
MVSQTTGVSPGDIRDVAQLIASCQRPAIVYGKGITRQDEPKALKALIELARLVGALDDEHSALISTKGQANSLAAYIYGLDKPFEVNGHQAAYLALGDDKPSQRLIKRLKDTPFIAVQASYGSPVTAMADVVLPVEMWAEQEGHYLNLAGGLQEAHGPLMAPEEVWSNASVLQAIAAKLDVELDTSWKEALERRSPVNAIQE